MSIGTEQREEPMDIVTFILIVEIIYFFIQFAELVKPFAFHTYGDSYILVQGFDMILLYF